MALENIPLNEAATVIVASATSTPIGAAASNNVDISGTTAITSFDTVAEGINRKGRFTGILTLTHNATSLILPGAANITTATNDRYEARSLGSGNWLVTKYEKADGTAVVNMGLSSKIVIATRDVSLASGTQAITGAGFKPTAAIFLTTVPYESGKASWGMADATLASQLIHDNNTDIASTYDYRTGVVVIQNSNYLNRSTAVVASWDADGCTLSWTKVGTVTGTATMTILFLK